MRIVITGGPGGGKTTALDLFKRELLEKVVVVPESATAIFKSGIKRDDRSDIVKAIQKTIFDYQKNVEMIYRKQNPEKVLLCDRGTLDGLAYWPNSEESFFEIMESSFEHELKRYDAVIFFETAAKSGADITTNNIYRNESNDKAIELDRKLKDIWSKHPHFHLVKSEGNFIDKIVKGISVLKEVVN